MTTASIDNSRFLAERHPIWEALGTKLESDPGDIHETLEVAGLDFQYITAPLSYVTPNGERQDAKFKTVLRSPTNEVEGWQEVGIVGPKYTYLQNTDLLRGIRYLQAETGWALDTLGTIGAGGQIFFTLKAGERTIFGDKLETYVVIHDAKAQRRALSIAILPMRLICTNQIVSGHNNVITLTHRPDLPGEYQFWTKMLGRLHKQQIEVYNDLEFMGSTHITDAQAKTIIERAYPMPRISSRVSNLLHISASTSVDPAVKAEIRKHLNEASGSQDKAREQVTARRASAFTLYERINAGDEQGIRNGGERMSPQAMENLVRTPYAVLQAITELVDWGGQAAATVAAGSSLFGQGANVKMRAWKACLAAAK